MQQINAARFRLTFGRFRLTFVSLCLLHAVEDKSMLN